MNLPDVPKIVPHNITGPGGIHEYRKEAHSEIHKKCRRGSCVLMKRLPFGKQSYDPYTQGQCNAQPHRSTLPVTKALLDLHLLFSVLPRFLGGFCSDTRPIFETYLARSLIALNRNSELFSLAHLFPVLIWVADLGSYHRLAWWG